MSPRSCLAAVVATVLFSCAATAQSIPSSELPGRERERFREPQRPLAQPGAPNIELPSTTAPPGAESVYVHLRQVTIRGSTIYSQKELSALYKDLLGQRVSLTQIYELAKKVTARYGRDGYVLSRAIVPPQKLAPKAATVRIDVIEGYIDEVQWPSSLSRYRDFFADYAARITAERPVNIRTLERYLLLASDLPGLRFSSSLKASDRHPAASTLVVEVTKKSIEASARVDNRGTQARGPIQVLASGTLNNLLKQHESLTLTWAAASPVRELQYVSANYRQVLSSEGWTLLANASLSGGSPGTFDLQTLQFKTTGTYIEAGFSKPVIRSRELNLSLTGLAFASNSSSDVLDAPFNRDKLRGFRARVEADAADAAGGINQFSATFSQGLIGAGSSQNGDPDLSRAVGRVDFNKIEGTISRIQPLWAPLSVFAAVYGQYAFTPLLVPEQCGYGGRSFGRAFDPSQFLGDSCAQALFELRADLPIAPLTQSQLYGFWDWGHLVTRDASVGTPAILDAASIGTGVRLGYQDYLRTDLQIAKGIEGPQQDWRFFFAVSSRY